MQPRTEATFPEKFHRPPGDSHYPRRRSDNRTLLDHEQTAGAVVLEHSSACAAGGSAIGPGARRVRLPGTDAPGLGCSKVSLPPVVATLYNATAATAQQPGLHRFHENAWPKNKGVHI